MSNKVGRSSKYESHIKANLDKIQKMLNDGATEKQVAQSLGVSYASWNHYKTKFEEFGNICKTPRTKQVEELRGALIKRALGFNYTEVRKYVKEGEDGKLSKFTEYYTRYALPDVAAINLALKNYDKDNWSNDPALLELKKQELLLKQLPQDDSGDREKLDELCAAISGLTKDGGNG